MTNTDTTRVEIAARELRPILTGLGKIVRKSALPALGCVRVRTTRGGLAELATTDLDRWTSVRLCGVANAIPGEFLVPLAQLRQFLKRAKPSDVVTLRPKIGRKNVEVAIAGTIQTIEAPPIADFPSPPAFKGKAQPLPDGASRAILEASACASTDQTRYVLNGVHLDTSGKGHHIVGTDGRHLYTANSFKLPLSSPATLASHPLLAWKPMRNTERWSVRLARNQTGSSGSYEITAGHWSVIGKLIAGNYPAWRQVVPDRNAFKAALTIDPEHLESLAATVAKLDVARSVDHRPITLRKEGNTVVMHWRNAASKMPRSQPLPATKSVGKGFTIQLNQPYLAKALSFGLGHAQLGDELEPMLFTGEGGRQMVAMPLRITHRTAPPPYTPGKQTPTPTKPQPAPMPPKASKKPTPNTPPRPMRPATTETPACPIDGALAEIATLKDKLRTAAADLQRVTAHLKQAKQHQRTSQREVRSVRNTLESLRKVRL